MSLEMQFIAALQLLLALALSMVIGMNRERREKDAGLRTHMLVGLGACLFTILSRWAFGDSDGSRVASNIVTGIGFLGAGVIYRGENKIHDLTTAASIWATASLGMAVGTGAWFLAICATILIWFTLDLVWRIRHARGKNGAHMNGPSTNGGQGA